MYSTHNRKISHILSSNNQGYVGIEAVHQVNGSNHKDSDENCEESIEIYRYFMIFYGLWFKPTDSRFQDELRQIIIASNSFHRLVEAFKR